MNGDHQPVGRPSGNSGRAKPTKFTQPVPGHWTTDEGTEMANRYTGMERGDLAFGHKSDLEMANAIYMADRNSLDLIMLQTAAKERIRWLSVQLAIARKALSGAQP